MNSIYESLVIFLLVFAGAVVGICLRRVLPDEHFSADAKVVIRLSSGLVITMTGLVLGMLVSSAKSSYDAQKIQVAQMASKLVLLDRTLDEYGPETGMMRAELRGYVAASINRIWPQEASAHAQLQPENGADKLYAELQSLVPANNRQSVARANAIAILADLRQSNWLMFLESESSPLSMPLLVVLVSWLVAIFISFGLFAPPNPTVIVTLLVGALAVSAAILIIIEMNSPFSGILRISPAPLHDALSQLGH